MAFGQNRKKVVPDWEQSTPELGIAEFIHRLRGHMSINNLAHYSGVSKAEICRIEQGERPAPHPHILQKLAGALGVEADELFRAAGYLSGNPFPPLRDNDFKAVGLRIQAARETAGQSIEQLAKRIGVQTEILTRCEAGAECPREFAMRIARVLHIPFAQLCGGKSYPATTQELIERAFQHIRKDREYRFGAVHIEQVSVKREIVRMYEQARGIKLLPDYIV